MHTLSKIGERASNTHSMQVNYHNTFIQVALYGVVLLNKTWTMLVVLQFDSCSLVESVLAVREGEANE